MSEPTDDLRHLFEPDSHIGTPTSVETELATVRQHSTGRQRRRIFATTAAAGLLLVGGGAYEAVLLLLIVVGGGIAPAPTLLA